METVVAKKHPLQTAATTGNGLAYDLQGTIKNLSIYIEGSAGVGAGAVQLETATDPAYAGTWHAIGSPVTVSASTQKLVQLAGVVGAVRARISTTVTGGTCSVFLYAS